MDVNGISVHYLSAGEDGAEIVLLHGLLGSGLTWGPVASPLSRDHVVVMPDARGHGESTAPATGYRYEDLALDVVALIHELELDRPVLVGHSMGGMTAAVVAASHGELLRGVVLVDPTFLSPERQQEVYESDVAEQHRRTLGLTEKELFDELRARHPKRTDDMLERIAQGRLETSPNAFEVLAPPNPAYRELVRLIAIPTMLVVGDNPVVTPDIVDELRAINPLLRVETIREAGHGVPFDQPDRLAAVIAQFAGSID
ncbi:MAG TPA: alpha/beta hydrolase [Kofleriaceae bacterium]